MPFYNDLRPQDDYLKEDYALIFPTMKDFEKKRTLENLLKLREGLSKDIVKRKTDYNLIIASWNIKEFGHTTQRLCEAYFYIAEIMSRFDLIVVQEVKSGLKDLYIIMRILGNDWDYIINDITEGTDGNSERSAFIFNSKRVEFAGLAGEIILWDKLTQNTGVKQLKRTPYITGFRAGWKTFSIISMHLHPGDDNEDIEYRRQEVSLLLKALKEKIDKEHLWNNNIILAGDFNFYSGQNKDDDTVQLINKAGYKEIESLRGKDTNASQTEAYDRLFISSNKYFILSKNDQGLDNGGVFNPFDYVYEDGDEQVYKTYMKAQYTGKKDMDDPDNLEKYYMHPWRKNQLSDHFPIWFELITDSSDNFLYDKLQDF